MDRSAARQVGFLASGQAPHTQTKEGGDTDRDTTEVSLAALAAEEAVAAWCFGLPSSADAEADAADTVDAAADGDVEDAAADVTPGVCAGGEGCGGTAASRCECVAGVAPALRKGITAAVAAVRAFAVTPFVLVTTVR
ncbi:hypothetical protein HK100_010502, partial [Physocladia obscura]